MKKLHSHAPQRHLILAAAILLPAIAAGCTKVPDKAVSPMVKIEPVVQDNREMFRLHVSAGIQNENSDTALLDIKGALVIRDGKDGTPLLTLPFTVPYVLPYDTGVVEIDRTLDEAAVMPLVHLLGSDRDKLIAEKGIERTSLDENKVELRIDSYQKRPILELLKEKQHDEGRRQ